MQFLFIVVTLFVLITGPAAPAAQPRAQGQQLAMLKINKEYDKRTIVKKSLIPNGGNGLFALVKIKKGEVIGELGGRFATEDDPALGNHYIAAIAECAWKETRPYKYLDTKDTGAHVSRINFAPSKINGSETQFQNAAVKQLCQHPYFVFVALNDIEPGAEIWSSYGPHYDYDRFMNDPQVQKFFCGLAKINCRGKFTFEH
jgi:SET domain-containing protein